MKKLILPIVLLAFSFGAKAQCDAQSTLVTVSCGSVCLTAEIPRTGFLQADMNNFIHSNGTMRRKPNQNELIFAAFALEEMCD